MGLALMPASLVNFLFARSYCSIRDHRSNIPTAPQQPIEHNLTYKKEYSFIHTIFQSWSTLAISVF